MTATKSIYEIAVLGDVSDDERARLGAMLARLIQDFGLEVGVSVMVRGASDFVERNTHAAFAAAYFGRASGADLPAAQAVVDASLPIIPVVDPTGSFTADIPAILQGSNGLRLGPNDPDMIELSTALLECLGLLRRQRRVFVSYRRVESRAAALQLHDLLGSRGFDVFLDTHDVRPGDPFQEVLWQRLCDSDVMVMLDTPTYFDNRWTRQEIGRARAKEIHVLRVVWPDYSPKKLADLAETIYLEPHELSAPDGPIIDSTANSIVLAVEDLRSRSIASRYLSITGKLRADVERIGGAIEGIGAHRAIAMRLLNDVKLWAYPVVGVPTAELLNDVADKASRASQSNVPVLVYDHIGIQGTWSAHLEWLDTNIKSVRAIKVAEAAWTLATWGD